MHRLALFAAAISLGMPQHLPGQPSRERSPVEELLDRARNALNDLQYARADSMAREVVALGNRARRNHRVSALQIIAIARFPESEQERDSTMARVALSQLVKLDLDARIPREFAWSGLDELYEEVRRATYSISAVVKRDNPILGIDGVSTIRVRSNRPTRFVLQARVPASGETVVIDSVAAAVDTVLKLRVARDGRPILQSGEYQILVLGTDLRSSETVARRFEAVALVPTLDVAAVPRTVDLTKVQPERAAPQRVRGIVAGVLAGASAIAIGKTLRGSEPIKSSGATDGRATTLGVFIAVAVGAAAWFDRGEMLSDNIAANRRLMREFEENAARLVAENEQRKRDYRANISINPEGL